MKKWNSTTYDMMLGLVAEIVLDEALRKYQTEQIDKAIDQALVQWDSDTFIRLTDELKNLSL